MTSRKGVQIATAALFTNPSILGRGDSADLFVDSWQLEAIITTLSGKPGCFPVSEIDSDNVEICRGALFLIHWRFGGTSLGSGTMMENIQMVDRRFMILKS